MISFTQNFAASLCERLGWALLHTLWQFAAIGLVTWFILVLSQRRTANFRYIVACSGLVGMFACFVITLASLLQSGSAVSSAASPIAAAERIEPAQQPAIVAKQADPPAPAAQQVVNQSVSPLVNEPTEPVAESVSFSSLREIWNTIAQSIAPWSPSFAYLWIAGVVFLSIRNVTGWISVNKLKRLATKPSPQNWSEAAEKLITRMKIRRPVKVLESLIAQVPIVIGWLRPVILVPVSLVGELSTEQIEAILAHELAHIRRHDYLVNLLQTALETLLFYHPAVWIVSRKIREERELCCDDMAVQVCQDKLSLGEALTLVAATQVSQRLAMAATGNCSSGVFRRVRRLFETPKKPSNYVKLLATLAVFSFLGLTVAGFTVVRTEEKPAVKDLLTAEERAAELKSEEKLSDAEALAQRITLILEKKKFEFLDTKKLESLRIELRDYFNEKITTPLSPELRKSLLDGAENSVLKKFYSEPQYIDETYLKFRQLFETMKWQLWVAANRPQLDEAQVAKRNEQFRELHRWVDDAPSLPTIGGEKPTASWLEMVKQIRKQNHTTIDEIFNDSLDPFFYEPLSEDELKVIKTKVDSLDKKTAVHSVAHTVFGEAVKLKYEDGKLFARWPLPKIVTGYGISNSTWMFGINQSDRNGSLHLMDVNNQFHAQIYGDVMKFRTLTNPAPKDPSKLEEWLENYDDKGLGTHGDIYFDMKRGEIIGVRGAKLATLNVKTWYQADMIGIDELKKMIKEDGKTSVSESLFRYNDPAHSTPDHPWKRLKPDAPFLIVQTKEGRIVVIRVQDNPMQDHLHLHIHRRPLEPNLPLHPGDVPEPNGKVSRSESEPKKTTEVRVAQQPKFANRDGKSPRRVVTIAALDNTALIRDKKLMQGTWKVVSIHENEKDVTKERKNDYYRFWVDGNKITSSSAQTDNDGFTIHQESELQFVIDPKKSPKQLNMMGTDFVSRGIYKVEKDSLVTAFYEKKLDQFPASFESSDEKNTRDDVLVVYKFERIPDAESKRQNIAGTWKFSAPLKKPNEFSVAIATDSENKIDITGIDDKTGGIEFDQDVFKIVNPEFSKGVLTFKLVGKTSTKEFRGKLFEDIIAGVQSSRTESSVFEAKRVKSPDLK